MKRLISGFLVLVMVFSLCATVASAAFDDTLYLISATETQKYNRSAAEWFTTSERRALFTVVAFQDALTANSELSIFKGYLKNSVIGLDDDDNLRVDIVGENYTLQLIVLWDWLLYHVDGKKTLNGAYYSMQSDGYTVYYNSSADIDKAMSTSGFYFAADPAPSGKNGWLQEKGNWYYYANNVKKTGWVQDGGWYYLDKNGKMLTGWQKIDGAWYYLSPAGPMVTGWQKIGASWYYFENSGVMKTGWYGERNRRGQTDWYYLKPGGEMAIGWLQIDGAWYYFNASGIMVTGVQWIDGTQYVFNSNGVWVA